MKEKLILTDPMAKLCNPTANLSNIVEADSSRLLKLISMHGDMARFEIIR